MIALTANATMIHTVESSTGQEPWGLALDDFGVLWVAASASNIVRRIGIATGVVETVIPASDLGSGSGPFGVWVAHDGVPDNVAYEVTKALYENLPIMGQVHAQGKNITLQTATAFGNAPLHPGAARYFKEKGIAK